MRVAKLVMLTVGVALLALDGGAFAQAPGVREADPAQVRRIPRRAPTRIEVYPSRRYYRECVDWLAVEHRPSGTVITPQMRCRWAVR